jgi:hypothetical protein
LKRFTAFFAPIFKNLWQTTPPDCCREQTGKIKKFSLRLPKRPLFTVVVVNSGQNTPPQSLYWWSKPVYPQTRAAEESGSFLEQDSTAVPKFAFRSFCPCGNLVGECLPQTLLMRLAPLKNPSKYFFGFFKNSSASHPVFLLLVRGHHAQKGGFTMRKRYNTPHRSRVVKTRMTEEEYAEFAERLSAYNMSQAEFIRQAITGAAIRPIITVSPVNDELLAAVGKLTAEYGRIGGNLNQIARTLNEWHSPYPQLAGEVRAAVSDLAALKFEVLQKVGDAVGNIQTYQL